MKSFLGKVKDLFEVSRDGYFVGTVESIRHSGISTFEKAPAKNVSWSKWHTLKHLTQIGPKESKEKKWSFLNWQYKDVQTDRFTRQVLSILNSMLTQNRAVITIDKKNCQTVISNDRNHPHPVTLDDSEYPEFFRKLFATGIFECKHDGKKYRTTTIIKLSNDFIEKHMDLSLDEVNEQLNSCLTFVRAIRNF